MEVVVHSTLNSIQGRVIVATDPSQTLDSLITAFCIDKGITHHRHYVLRNKDLEVLSSHKKIGVCGVQNGDILFLGVRETTEDWCCGCNQWWLIATVALLIGCAGLVAITVLHIQQNETIYEYGVVTDAGSSHSQVYVYKWPGGKKNGTAIPEQIFSNKTVPGISNYTADPSLAGASLEPLLQRAVNVIPTDHRAGTPIYLGATAGMRLLNASDKPTSDAILNSTRFSIAKYGLDFSDPYDQARIILGKEEGAFSWVTVNYLYGMFRELARVSFTSFLTSSLDPITRGALDLGGASTQITFLPEHDLSPNSTDYETLLMYGHNYQVYTHSYLCYGLNEAHRQYLADLVLAQNYSAVIQDPCRPQGDTSNVTYADIFEVPCTLNKTTAGSPHQNETFQFTGTSNVARCKTYTHSVFDFSATCDNPPCSFNGISQPTVFGEFLAFSGFFYTMRFLNLTTQVTITLEDFTAATNTLCAADWAKVSQMQTSDPPMLPKYCFNAVFIHTLLINGYKFDDHTFTNIKFLNNVEGNELGWTLGYMLNASNAIPASRPEQRISTLLFILMVVLFSIFLGIAVGFACHARRDKAKQNQYQKMATYGSI